MSAKAEESMLEASVEALARQLLMHQLCVEESARSGGDSGIKQVEESARSGGDSGIKQV